jgi:sodium transport system permease protein
LQGFNRERAQRLLARGVSPQVLQPLQIEEINLAGSRARGAQLLFLVPWLALVGAVVGAISVAIDVTAGERERGSLEPLLMNPVSTASLVLGKWAVAASCSAAVVVLTLFGFTGRCNSYAANPRTVQFGAPNPNFLVLLLPFSAMVASLNMLTATSAQPRGAGLRQLHHDDRQLRAVIPVLTVVTRWQFLSSTRTASRADARASR